MSGATCTRLIPLIILLVAAACGGSQAQKTDPVAAPVTQEYRIGAGDQLSVFVFNHPELSLELPVRPDGLLSTPLVENLQAAGKTPSELARDMETRLAEYVRSPKVNIIVIQAVGAMGDQVRVVGQAAKPQALPFRANMTLLDVMIQVGGLGEFAAGNRARVIRTVNGQRTEIPVRLNDLLNKGDMNANLAIQPGDVVMIPETRF